VAFVPFKEVAGSGVPETDDAIKRTSSDVATIGTDGNRGNAILGTNFIISEDVETAALFDTPDASLLVATTRDDESAIIGKVKRIDIHGVALEGGRNVVALDIPELDRLVFSTTSQVLAVWTEAH